MKLIEMNEDELLKKYAEGERDFRKIKLIDEWAAEAFPLRGVVLKGADLSFSDLSGTCIPCADLEETILMETKMPETLIAVDLRKARINFVDFSRCDLYGALIAEAYIIASMFDSANMQKVLMDDSEIKKSHFRGTDLRKASLGNCKVYDSDFRGADLSGVDVEGATIHKSNFCDAKGVNALIGSRHPRTWNYVNDERIPFFIKPYRSGEVPDAVNDPDSKYNIVNRGALR